jgi:2'-5' RNA ligase
VTLRFLGEADPDEAAGALEGLVAESAVAELGPVTRLLGNRIVMVPVAGLDDLASAVVAATAEVGEPPEDRAFVGHLTLARAKEPVPPGTVGTPIVGTFPVEQVCLVRSRTLPEGAAYETMERFSLG